MNKPDQERLFKSMNELNDMLIDVEREVGKAGAYSLEYDIQQLENLICSVREGLEYYLEHGIEEAEAE